MLQRVLSAINSHSVRKNSGLQFNREVSLRGVNKVEISLFVMALVVAYLLPGPDMILVLETGARQGRLAALATAIGLALARSIHVILSAIGLSVLFKTVPWTFDIVRYAGSAYLMWLGFGILWANGESIKAGTSRVARNIVQRSIWLAIQRGLLTNLLNPKALLFCSVLLPQFVSQQEGPSVLQFAQLGVVLVAIGLIFDIAYSIGGSWLGRVMNNNPGLARFRCWLFGTLLIGFGARLGFSR